MFIVVVPVLLRARSVALRQRITLVVIAGLACGAVLAPWTIYNSTRFKEPVLLSTNDGGLLLIGNCPPSTYSGAQLGYFDTKCVFRLSGSHKHDDRSQLDSLARSVAVQNIEHNLGKMPLVVPARFGRLLAVFRPSQTVGRVASWMTTSTKAIWAWVVSYWVLLLLAIGGPCRRADCARSCCRCSGRSSSL